jgi:DoxX-like family
MNPWLTKHSTALLRWTFGVVVLLHSIWFAAAPAAGHGFSHFGLPAWVRPALGSTEALGALLLLVPAASVAGGFLLLVIFALAILIHLLHGDAASTGGLFVYVAVVLECMSRRKHDGTQGMTGT